MVGIEAGTVGVVNTAAAAAAVEEEEADST